MVQQLLQQEEKEEDRSFLLLEELPDDIFSLVLQFAYCVDVHAEEEEEEESADDLAPSSYTSSINWKEFINGVFSVSKTMRDKAIIFAQTNTVCMSMSASHVPVLFGCKYKLRPRSLVLVDADGDIPSIISMTKYLLGALDLSLLKHLKIEDIMTYRISDLKHHMKQIMRPKNKNVSSHDQHHNSDDEEFIFDNLGSRNDEALDVKDTIASVLEKKDDLCIDSLYVASGYFSSSSGERLVRACSHTLTRLKLDCCSVNEEGGNLTCCQNLKELIIKMFLIKTYSVAEKNYFPIRLPSSIEHLSIYFVKRSDVHIDLDDIMAHVTKYIQHLPNLKSLTITSSFTWPTRTELHIESESLEQLELPKEFNVDIVRCICPLLKEIRLNYYDDAQAGVEGHDWEDLVTSRIVPQVLQPMYKRELSESTRVVNDKESFTTYCMSTIHKISNDFMVHDDCVAKFNLFERHQESIEDEDLDEYDRYIFDSDSDDGDFLTPSSYLYM